MKYNSHISGWLGNGVNTHIVYIAPKAGDGIIMTKADTLIRANEDLSRRSLLVRIWTVLWRPSSRFSLAALLIAGGIAGIIFWGGFNWAMELTNTEAFCVSCHEMRDNVYKELQETVHFRNRSGVRAICSDCHVPHDWIYKVRRKIQATNELFHKVVGTIDTPEKFEKHRLELAQSVWETMKSTDSRECRNCHSPEAMDSHKQSEAAKIMSEALKNGLTCIDCHKGIAHHLPKEEEEAGISDALSSPLVFAR